MQNNITNLIKNFGGLTKMSQAINVPISTIQGWEKSGKIPHWRCDVVNKAIEENNINVSLTSEEAENENTIHNC